MRSSPIGDSGHVPGHYHFASDDLLRPLSRHLCALCRYLLFICTSKRRSISFCMKQFLSCMSTCREHRLQHVLLPSMLETLLFRIRDRPRSCMYKKQKKIKKKVIHIKKKRTGKKITKSRGVQNPCVHRVCLVPWISPLTDRMLIVSAAAKKREKSKPGRQRDEQDKTLSAAPDTHFPNPIQEDEFGLGGCRHWAYYFLLHATNLWQAMGWACSITITTEHNNQAVLPPGRDSPETDEQVSTSKTR
ncbi:hypothetical protein HDV62DRAFT_79318 [Trichoderma sp. SZMC 28011]